ncbi:MAG: polymer-forming cytoskeletal protein [Bacteroidota bacterium]|nr:polymer-forming cytoskeletal protein [Bacteroidota bacterium]
MKEFNKDEVSIISAGVVIEGKLSSSGNIRIDGRIKGDVIVTGNVTVGETGEVDGQVHGDVVTLGGKVNGTVNAKERLVLEAKANLKGDILTKILVVEAGAIFEGKSNMGSLKEKPAENPALPLT